MSKHDGLQKVLHRALNLPSERRGLGLGAMMRFTINDVLRVGKILSQAARTEVMPRFGRLVTGGVREKSSRFDVVTDADDAAELAISPRLWPPTLGRS